MLDTRHKATDITQDDIRAAARGQGQDLEQAVQNLQTSLDSMTPASGTTDADAQRVAGSATR
jgi:hypothetical protein